MFNPKINFIHCSTSLVYRIYNFVGLRTFQAVEEYLVKINASGMVNVFRVSPSHFVSCI